MFQLLLAVIYLAFIGLGLPDAMLGAAWPQMYTDLSMPVSYAGIISVIIAAGTIVSSLMSERMTKWLGVGKLTAISTAITAVALLAFALSPSFIWLCIVSIPYGLGAGSVDAALNSYVALHYKSHHMSWLHCMWGVGATAGPYIIGLSLAYQGGWRWGYGDVFLLQAILTVLLLITLPMWSKKEAIVPDTATQRTRALTLREILSIRGAKELMVAFFASCAIEQTASLWASSYLVLHHGVETTQAASWAAFYFLGITGGRAISGFFTMRFHDTQMIRGGMCIVAVGIAVMALPLGTTSALVSLILIGLGCSPIYPCIIHATPTNFGAENAQAITGVQMASAYVGTMAMPAVFGLIANHLDIGWYPLFLGGLLVLSFVMFQAMQRKLQ